MSGGWAGAVLGLGAGAGATLTLARLPAARRPSLDDRLAPYLLDRPRPSRLLHRELALTPFPTLERVLGPVILDGVRLLERVLGGSATVRRRLELAGRDQTVEQFRAEQLLWGGCALLAALALSLLATLRGGGDPVGLAVLCGVAAMLGVVLRDKVLSSEVTRREARMLAELPTVAELLALSVAAGEGALGALERVSRVGSGELATVLGDALAHARAGAPLVQALDAVARRSSLPALSRFVDGIVVAVERGTPLADVLRAQACDVREAGKRQLLEAGGRKEILMMIPVVFLCMPVTVVFALFPGFLSLSFPS